MYRSLIKYMFFTLCIITPFAVNAAIEEIIVTAEKRESNLQDVAGSVTALDSSAIIDNGIIDISGLENAVPGLRIGISGGEARPAMRGMRTNDVGVAGTGIAEQMVGIFQDGIYVPTTTAAMSSYVDVERIEVLRGPQGTLYGRNTFAGSINVISKSPNFDNTEGSFGVHTGDYNRQGYQGVINIPISDSIATRFAVAADSHDGIINNHNVAGPSDDLREKDSFYVRSTTLLDISPALSATFRMDYFNKEANTEAIWGYQQIAGYQISQTDSGLYNPVATVTGGHIYKPSDAVNDDLGPYDVYRNAISIDEQEIVSTSLVIDYETDFASLRATGNISKISGHQFYDNDYSDGGLDFVGGFGRQDDQDASSLEVQLTSKENSSLSWLAGVYMYSLDADWEWLWRADGQIVVPGWGNPSDDPMTTESTAIYGQISYSVSEKLNVTGGLRFNSDEKEFTGSEEEWSSDSTLWKVSAKYDVNDASMLYGSISTGIRTGGLNDARVVSRGAEKYYDNEDVISFEVGVKNTFFDNTLLLNASLFSNVYSDVRSQVFAVACQDTTSSKTIIQCVADGEATTFEYSDNGGDVETTGLEAEIKWAPSDRLFVSASLSMLDAEFESGYEIGNSLIRPLMGLGNIEGRQDINDQNNPGFNFGGWRPALSPEYTLGIFAKYDFTLPNGTTLSPSVSTTFVGDYFGFDTNIPETKVESHAITNIRATWESGRTGLEVSAFVNNVTDETVLKRAVVHSQLVNALPANSVQANWNNPRVWGMSAKYSF